MCNKQDKMYYCPLDTTIDTTCSLSLARGSKSGCPVSQSDWQFGSCIMEDLGMGRIYTSGICAVNVTCSQSRAPPRLIRVMGSVVHLPSGNCTTMINNITVFPITELKVYELIPAFAPAETRVDLMMTELQDIQFKVPHVNTQIYPGLNNTWLSNFEASIQKARNLTDQINDHVNIIGFGDIALPIVTKTSIILSVIALLTAILNSCIVGLMIWKSSTRYQPIQSSSNW